MAIDKQRKKELSETYVTSWRPMGVYQIRNTVNGKIYVAGSMDLDGARNRLAFMIQVNGNAIRELDDDWKRYGGEAFVFEELDRIKPREEAPQDRSDLRKYREEVDALLELWLDKLQPYGDRGYNKPKRRP